MRPLTIVWSMLAIFALTALVFYERRCACSKVTFQDDHTILLCMCDLKQANDADEVTTNP